MDSEEIEKLVLERAERFFSSIKEEQVSVFNRGHWIGKTLAWCMKNPEFKTRLFRFVDVFPSLTDRRSLTRHLREYFGTGEDVPEFFKKGARVADYGGFVGKYLLQKAIAANIRSVARQFIVGENQDEALTRLLELRKEGFGFTLDFLGEAVVSENEAEKVFQTYLGLLDRLETDSLKWHPLGGEENNEELDWGSSPKVNVSVKPSALYSQVFPEDFEGTINGILARLERIYERIMKLKGSMCIDMESYSLKEMTLEIYRRLRLRYPEYPFLGIAIQSYLKDTDQDLEELIQWASKHEVGVSVRLVKGAYWDYEIARALRNNWPIPVYTNKAETDAAFERHARFLLENHNCCYLACASHNIRSLAFVLENAEALKVPDLRYEFQLLFGMAEPIANELVKEGQRVRLYAPYGEMVGGMAYLVRRLLENTANQSFLRQLFAEEAAIGDLIQKPRSNLLPSGIDKYHEKTGKKGAPVQEIFENCPVPDFSLQKNRENMEKALSLVKNSLGLDVPLFIEGKEIWTSRKEKSHDPAHSDSIVGRVCMGDPEHTAAAIAAGKKHFPAWKKRPVEERAEFLRKAAEIARGRFFELASWQVFEVGKPWEQACADVCEGIDFLEYYALQMTRLAGPIDCGSFFGESNMLVREGRGVAAVIAPWNFPFAISVGMTSAALVAGNTVVYKPSERSPVIGSLINDIYQKSGLPAGVFNFLPGLGNEVGKFLVDHPDVSLLAFTGSMRVGLELIDKAGQVRKGQEKIKKVIAEMGGKNAIIIDDDADLDEAVPAVIHSAFGFQGQKCSACSRAIVLEGVYDRFVERLLNAVDSLRIGPAADAGNFLGPVIDGRAREAILDRIEVAKQEFKLLYSGELQADGYYVPVSIFGDVSAQHPLAQEEIFGPVLALIKVRSFEEALEKANGTLFALTGGVFSRSPHHIDLATKQFEAGNLYINRGITGALVGRQPFGGYRMSGLGSKAGGEDYLLNFVESRSICENTLRRGFAPELET